MLVIVYKRVYDVLFHFQPGYINGPTTICVVL